MCRTKSIVRNGTPLRKNGTSAREKRFVGPRRPNETVIKKQKGNRLHRRDPERWAELKQNQVL